MYEHDRGEVPCGVFFLFSPLHHRCTWAHPAVVNAGVSVLFSVLLFPQSPEHQRFSYLFVDPRVGDAAPLSGERARLLVRVSELETEWLALEERVAG